MNDDCLTLSMKFYDNMVINVNIVEEGKEPEDRIGKSFKISQDVYDTLDEIETRYVREIERKVKEVRNHKKFVSQFRLFEDLVSHLEEERMKNPTLIPYKLAIFDHYPQHIVLTYLPPSS